MSKQHPVVRWGGYLVLSLLLAGIMNSAIAQEKEKTEKIIELAKFIDGLSKNKHWKLLYNPDDLAGKYVEESTVTASKSWTITGLAEWIKKYNLQLQQLGGDAWSLKKMTAVP